ncbi:ferrous iron transport protein B [Pilibacter termitis]|uniref:Ferrous iron transport protein B n=1 Tax=Pilibacter termitis TaxID=263852 RepID=A0A1T4K7G0_9ENTE|nr:ferrous iron transport protein B [Pilibacter termitis]SJZ38349.1 ferrous iron transport protein B [Pilibacter termitis]
MKNKIEIALAGNPNSGKTSTFNHLTGSMQHVGNWPGVTVERKSGQYRKNTQIELQDLPGIYSMSPYTPEEIVARDYLLSNSANAIIDIVDATNLERNLYLTTQLMETGIPVVIGLNMMDILEKQNRPLNIQKLSYGLGVPVVPMSALKKKGLNKAVKKALYIAQEHGEVQFPTYDNRLEVALAEILDVLGNTVPTRQARWFAIKLFERDEKAEATLDLSEMQKKEIEEIIQITEKVFDDDAEAIVVNERYNFVTQLSALCLGERDSISFTFSDKIDRIVTNRFLALPIFAGLMWLVYSISIQWIGGFGTDFLNEQIFGDWVPNIAEKTLENWQVAEWLKSLIIDGIIAGCGAVLGFLPQIIVLFFCLGILEDCGYMSRIAFVMDRIFRRFGLSGKSFIPMLIATGCGVPGVMASRTIENEKDRRITVMVTTFMPCSAKLPIIALIAGAFFPKDNWVAPSAYMVGIAAIILSGIALKKTKLFSSDATPFIMELPSYHLPMMKNVVRYAFEHGKEFVKRAATIIFVMNIVIWFTSSFSWQLHMVETEDSILASLGRVLAPIFAPIGWGNWKGTVATLTGLVAKETVVGTFGILFHAGELASEDGKEIWGNLTQSFTALSAYSFLLFNLLCAPCFAAIGAIHKEMHNFKWTVMAIAYQCGLAYVVSFLAYQVGLVVIEKRAINILTVLAFLLAAVILFLLVRKPAKKAELPSISSKDFEEMERV